MSSTTGSILLTTLIVVFSCNHIVSSLTNHQTEEGGFQPSVRYYESTIDTGRINESRKNDLEGKDSDRLERFGYVSSFGNTGNVQPYGSTGLGNSVPMKIDLGGVLLGALIGLGVVLIVPKITQLFAMQPNYRSLDDQHSVLTDIMAKLDNTLEQNHVDSNSCMQRVVCSYVHEAQKNMKDGAGSTIDEIIFSISNNPLFMLMLDGSTLKHAVDMGKRSDLDQCHKLYEKCPLTKDSVLQILSGLVQ